MAIAVRWPFVQTESKAKQIADLHKRIDELEKRGSGGVNVPGELFNVLYADESSSSIAVSEANALTISAVYSAINISCDSINVPVEVYRKQSNGSRIPVTDDNFYEWSVRQLLHTSPNLMHTPTQWFQLMEFSRLIYGNGYSVILRNNMDVPLALKWVHPDLVEIRLYQGRELRYWVRGEQGGYAYENVPAMDMIHVKNMSVNGITGMGVIAIAKDSLSGGLAAQKTSNKFYKDGMTSKVVLSHPGALKAAGKQNLQTSFEDELKKRTSIVLEEGMKVYTLTIPPEQAQFLESRVFSVTEVSRWFNIPEHMLGNNQHSTFSNIENQFLQFTINSVRPRLRAWEQELNWKLLANYPDVYVKFNMNALLRPDTAARSQYYMTAIQNGWMTRNEVRDLEDMNKLPGGDDALTPLNLATDSEREEKMSIPAPSGNGKATEEELEEVTNSNSN